MRRFLLGAVISLGVLTAFILGVFAADDLVRFWW